MIRLWIIYSRFASAGGAERVAHRLVTGLDRARFEPIVVTLYERGDLAEDLAKRGYCTLHAGAKGRLDMRIPLSLLRWSKQYPPDVVMTTTNLISLFWGTVLRQLRRTKAMVVRFQGTTHLRRHEPLVLRLRRRWIDHYISLTPKQAEFWITRQNIPYSRMSIVPNGIDVARFVPPQDKSALRVALGLPKDKVIVGCVSHFRPTKNLELFVEAASRIHLEAPYCHFLLVGDGDTRSQVETAIHQKGLADAFTLPGAQKDPAPWFQAMDVFVLPSQTQTEGFPSVIVEAGACGVPAVAFDVGGIADVILHGETGFVVPLGDTEQFIQRAITIATTPSLREAMGQKARQRVHAEYSLSMMIEKYSNLFERLVSESNNRLAWEHS
jgi:glycosyltransferase involved in cell wall biosynthesis